MDKMISKKTIAENFGKIFLAVFLFWNEITTILTSSISEGRGSVFRFEVPDHKTAMLIYSSNKYKKTEHDFLAPMFSPHPEQTVTKQLIKIVNGLHMVWVNILIAHLFV